MQNSLVTMIKILEANGYVVFKREAGLEQTGGEYSHYKALIADKKTIREKVIILLKHGWFSGHKLNKIVESTGAAPRANELKKKTPHLGWRIVERKHSSGKCNEFTLVPEKTEALPIIAADGQTQLFDLTPNHTKVGA